MQHSAGMTLRFSNGIGAALPQALHASYFASRQAAVILAKRLVSILGLLGVTWQECGENPAIFCYRIGWQVAEPLRGQLAAKGQSSLREEQSGLCSTPSGSSCTGSMTSEG